MTKQQSFKNESIQVELTRSPNCRVRMEIEAEKEIGIQAYQEAIKNIRKEVSLPGFRKGKVPEDVVVKQYGKSIEQEFRDLFLNKSSQEALKLCNVYPWDRSKSIKAEIKNISNEKKGNFTIEFETFPTIPHLNGDSLRITKNLIKEVSDRDVEDYIHDLGYRFATWEEEAPRPVKIGDFVTIKIRPEEAPESQAQENSHLKIDGEKTPKWIVEALVGKSPGDTFTVHPPKPDKKQEVDDLFADAPSQSRTLVVSLSKIEKPSLPQSDDEFAKKYGANDLEDLKNKVRSHLEKSAAEEAHGQDQLAVQKRILEQYPFDVPASLLAKELEAATEELIHELLEAGLTQKTVEERKEKIETVALKKALDTLRIHYILLQTIADQKLEVTEMEMMQEAIRASMGAGGAFNPQAFEEFKNNPNGIKQHLLMLKALDHLTKSAINS